MFRNKLLYKDQDLIQQKLNEINCKRKSLTCAVMAFEDAEILYDKGMATDLLDELNIHYNTLKMKLDLVNEELNAAPSMSGIINATNRSRLGNWITPSRRYSRYTNQLQ